MRTKLREILHWCVVHPDAAEARRIPERPFQEMADRLDGGGSLSEKQEAWINGIYEQLFSEPTYENLMSSGKAPRGKEVPTPAVLQNLPKKPPKRQEKE